MATSDTPDTSIANEQFHPDWGEKTYRQVSEAKKAAKKLTEDNYIIIKFNYYEFVFPFKEGSAILQSLGKAEAIADITYSYKKIIPLDGEHKIESRLITRDEYVEMKMRHILKLTEEPKPF